MHTLPRRLVHNRMVSRCIQPRRGIAAGGSCATFDLWALVGPVVLVLVRQYSRVFFSLHADDLSISVREETQDEAVETLRAVAAEVVSHFEGTLGLRFAQDEAALVGTHSNLVRRAAQGLQPLFPLIAAQSEVRRLGVDYNLRRVRRRAQRGTVRKARLASLFDRARRLEASFAAQRALKLFATGVLPAGFFGSEFGPWSGKGRTVLVARALAALRLRPPGVKSQLAQVSSPTSLDPEWKLMPGPLSRWAREVWLLRARNPRRVADALNGCELHLARRLIRNQPNLTGVLGALQQSAHFFGLEWPVAHVFRKGDSEWDLAAGSPALFAKCLKTLLEHVRATAALELVRPPEGTQTRQLDTV
jgi:hypothetical protein